LHERHRDRRRPARSTRWAERGAAGADRDHRGHQRKAALHGGVRERVGRERQRGCTQRDGERHGEDATERRHAGERLAGN
jgi:hypothetical protein